MATRERRSDLIDVKASPTCLKLRGCQSRKKINVETQMTTTEDLRARDSKATRKRGLICKQYEDVNKAFAFGPELGRGASGVVRKCYMGQTTVPLACKSVSKLSLRNQSDVNDMRAEVLTLQALQKHPSVVRLHGVYEDDQNIHMVMEMCEGGDLFSRIREVKCFSESDAAKVCKNLASALAYSHKLGIMHRDLKPENILLSTKHSNTEIRLADFGSASFFKQGQNLTQLVGSPLYIAPGVLKHNYGPEADLWSLGVILYIMLSGLPPFWGDSNGEIFSQIMTSDINLTRGRWPYISQGAKKLVSQLLNRDVSQALSAEDVLYHPWIVRNCLLRTPKQAQLRGMKNPMEFTVNPPTKTPLLTPQNPEVKTAPIRTYNSVTGVLEELHTQRPNSNSKQPTCTFLRGVTVHRSKNTAVESTDEIYPKESLLKALVSSAPRRTDTEGTVARNLRSMGRLRFF